MPPAPAPRPRLAPHERLVAALDVSDADAARDWGRRLRGRVGLVKVGLELFVAAGPPVVRQLREDGLDVFLDLKLHDIPNTVAGAVHAAAGLGCRMLTVHASGGPRMLEAAAAAAREFHQRDGRPAPLLLGVTVLTSLGPADATRLGLGGSLADRVVAWARMCRDCGLDGVVASAQEAAAVRQACGPDALIVTPGIRLAGGDAGDQRRVATPAEARAAGADYVVAGRALLRAGAALDAVLDEFARQLAGDPTA